MLKNKIQEKLSEEGRAVGWLATKLGKSRSYTSLMLNNHNQPDLAELERIAELLNCSYSELIEEVNQ